MPSLPSPDFHHLKAAVGWLELGNLTEATDELESITPQLRGHPDVLQVRCKIYCEAKKWESRHLTNTPTLVGAGWFSEREMPDGVVPCER